MGAKRRAWLVFAAAVGSALTTAVWTVRHVDDSRDFAVRYAAGALTAEDGDPYDPSALHRRMRVLEGNRSTEPNLYLFFDPPPTAAFFAAVSTIPFRVAVWIWIGLSFAAAAVVGLLCASITGFRRLSGAERATVAALGISFGPLRYGVAGAQIDPVLTLAALGAIAAARVRPARPALASTLAVIGSLKPQLGALPMASLVVRSRRLLAASVAAAFVVCAIPTVVTPSASWSGWWDIIRKSGSNTTDQLSLVVLCSIAAATCVVWVHARRKVITSPEMALSAAATTGVSVFAVLHLNPFSAALLAIPMVEVVKTGASAPVRRYVIAAVVGALMVGALTPATTYGGLRAAVLPIAGAALVAAAAAVFDRRLRMPAAVALAVNSSLVLAGLTITGTRVVCAFVSFVLAVLVATSERSERDGDA